MLKIGDIVGTEAQGGGLISRLIKFGNQDPGEPKTRVSHDAMACAPATYWEDQEGYFHLQYSWPGTSEKYYSQFGPAPAYANLLTGEIERGKFKPTPHIIQLTPENGWIMSRLVESTSPKVINTRTVGYYLAKGNCYIYRIKGLNEEALGRVVGFALDRVGQRYGFGHIGLYAVSAALGRLLSYPIYWIARLLRAKVNFRSPRIYRNDPKAPMVCSQLVAAAYASLPKHFTYPGLIIEETGYPQIEFGGPWGCIAPDDIDDWCLAESQLLDGRAEEIFVGGLKDV